MLFAAVTAVNNNLTAVNPTRRRNMKWQFHLGTAAAMAAAVGCSSATDVVDDDAEIIESSASVRELGIARYGVRVDAEGVDVQLRAADGGDVGFIVVAARNQGRVATFSLGGRVIEAELLGDHMIVSADGEQRASFSFDIDGLTPDMNLEDAGTMQGALTDIEADLAALVTIMSDPALRTGVDGLRGASLAQNETEYMFGLDDCPGWVWTSCLFTPTWAVCAYCAIAWL